MSVCECVWRILPQPKAAEGEKSQIDGAGRCVESEFFLWHHFLLFSHTESGSTLVSESVVYNLINFNCCNEKWEQRGAAEEAGPHWKQSVFVWTLKHLCSGVCQRANLSARRDSVTWLAYFQINRRSEKDQTLGHIRLGVLKNNSHWKRAQEDSDMDTSWSCLMKQTPANESVRLYPNCMKVRCDKSLMCRPQINAETGIQRHQKTTKMMQITPEIICPPANTRNLETRLMISSMSHNHVEANFQLFQC